MLLPALPLADCSGGKTRRRQEAGRGWGRREDCAALAGLAAHSQRQTPRCGSTIAVAALFALARELELPLAVHHAFL